MNQEIYTTNFNDLELKKRILASNLSDEDKIQIIEILANKNYYIEYPSYPKSIPGQEIWYNSQRLDPTKITC